MYCIWKGLKMKRFLYAVLFSLIFVVEATSSEIYLFYNGTSDNLDELEISKKEVAKIFDGEFGPASDELPLEVRFEDFYVAKYPDKSFVFILNAPFNCGQLGCNTIVFERDEDDDLVEKDSKKPVKCKIYDTDKLLCTEGGYKPKVPVKPRKKILHFPAPVQK